MGYGRFGGRPDKPLTEMTLQEVHDFGRKTMFPAERAAGWKEKDLSSAVGMYQITGNNIKNLAPKLGYDMATTKFTPDVQKQYMLALAPAGLTQWQGLVKKPALMSAAQKAYANIGKPPVVAGVPAITPQAVNPTLPPNMMNARAQYDPSRSSMGQVASMAAGGGRGIMGGLGLGNGRGYGGGNIGQGSGGAINPNR
jgi:hypothetical protein